MSRNVLDINLETLGNINPQEVAVYLQSKGWTKEGDFHGKAVAWVWKDILTGKEIEVLLPNHNRFQDFARHLFHLIDVLAMVEQRSSVQVQQDLANAWTDRIGIVFQRKAGTSLPLQTSLALLQNAQELMHAAATTALNQKLRLQNSLPVEIHDYFDNLKFEFEGDQLIIFSPVNTQNGRHITNTLYQSLFVLKSIEEDRVRDMTYPVDGLIPNDVITKLCQAFWEISGKIELHFLWAYMKPISCVNEKILFSRPPAMIVEPPGRPILIDDPSVVLSSSLQM